MRILVLITLVATGMITPSAHAQSFVGDWASSSIKRQVEQKKLEQQKQAAPRLVMKKECKVCGKGEKASKTALGTMLSKKKVQPVKRLSSVKRSKRV